MARPAQPALSASACLSRPVLLLSAGDDNPRKLCARWATGPDLAHSAVAGTLLRARAVVHHLASERFDIADAAGRHTRSLRLCPLPFPGQGAAASTDHHPFCLLY